MQLVVNIRTICKPLEINIFLHESWNSLEHFFFWKKWNEYLAFVFVDFLPRGACEWFTFHDINEQLPIQVIQFVLCNSCVPSFQRLFERFSILIEAAQQNFIVARNVTIVTTNTGTSFRKHSLLVVGHLYYGIDDRLKIKRIERNLFIRHSSSISGFFLRSMALATYLLLCTLPLRNLPLNLLWIPSKICEGKHQSGALRCQPADNHVRLVPYSPTAVSSHLDFRECTQLELQWPLHVVQDRLNHNGRELKLKQKKVKSIDLLVTYATHQFVYNVSTAVTLYDPSENMIKYHENNDVKNHIERWSFALHAGAAWIDLRLCNDQIVYLNSLNKFEAP